MNKLIITFLLLAADILNQGFSQTIDFIKIFGDNWDKAISFEKDNREWMKVITERNHISYPVAVAVIFPELIRYSALREKMEVSLLKTLYINLGDTYADFSVGVFQIKPSFAENLRKQLPRGMSRRDRGSFRDPSSFSDVSDFRKDIVAGLEDPAREMKYLVAFILLCEKKYGISYMDEEEKVRFLATAYNYGIKGDKESILAMEPKKYFNAKLFKTENYCYSDVALFWYKLNQHK